MDSRAAPRWAHPEAGLWPRLQLKGAPPGIHVCVRVWLLVCGIRVFGSCVWFVCVARVCVGSCVALGVHVLGGVCVWFVVLGRVWVVVCGGSWWVVVRVLLVVCGFLCVVARVCGSCVWVVVCVTRGVFMGRVLRVVCVVFECVARGVCVVRVARACVPWISGCICHS